MQKHAGRPKTEAKSAGVVHPHIGGMNTLGPKPVGGTSASKHEGVTDHRVGHSGGPKAAHRALGFGGKKKK